MGDYKGSEYAGSGGSEGGEGEQGEGEGERLRFRRARIGGANRPRSAERRCAV